jgi:RimJ/RimL family protein N-acetyltransferase
MVPGSRLHAGFAHMAPLPGRLALIAQSGSVLSAVLDWASGRGIGFSALLSLGEAVDVDCGDLLDYLAGDSATDAVLLAVESVEHVRKFMSAARAAARVKPVMVLKAGRRVVRAFPPRPSCRATARRDAVYDASFRRAGLLRVDDIQELFDAVETLGLARPPAGERLAVLTNGGGVGLLAADALIAEGAQLASLSPAACACLRELLPPPLLPHNPLDIGGDADAERYRRTLEVLLEEKGVDGVLALHCPNALASSSAAAEAVVTAYRKRLSRSATCTLLTSWLGDAGVADARRLFAENRIPTFATPTDAVRGCMQLLRFRRNRELLMQTPPTIPEGFAPDVERARSVLAAALAAGTRHLNIAQCTELLDAYDLRLSPQPPAHPAKGGDGTVAWRLEAFTDPHFGPVIEVGASPTQGWSHAGALALPPLNLHLAKEVLSRVPGAPCADPARGGDGFATSALGFALVKVSQLLCDLPEVEGLTLDPLLVDSLGVAAVDASLEIAPARMPASERLAIRPYPKELEEHLSLPDGVHLLLRPIRPEDEPAFQRLFARLSPEEILMRFMNPMRMLPRSLAARLTQIDYDREMAFFLEGKDIDGGQELFGGVRIMADPDNERGEFAILLRGDMTGLGLGPLLMRRIIDYARSRGMKEIYGEVLRDNRPMLKLCQLFAFKTRRIPEDPGVIQVTLDL